MKKSKRPALPPKAPPFKLMTEEGECGRVTGFAQVLAAVTRLTDDKKDEKYVVLDQGREGFVQFRRFGKGYYLEMMLGHYDSDHRPYRFVRARARGAGPAPKLPKGMDAFARESGEKLTLSEVLDLVSYFWSTPPNKRRPDPTRPWRDLRTTLKTMNEENSAAAD